MSSHNEEHNVKEEYLFELLAEAEADMVEKNKALEASKKAVAESQEQVSRLKIAIDVLKGN